MLTQCLLRKTGRTQQGLALRNGYATAFVFLKTASGLYTQRRYVDPTWRQVSASRRFLDAFRYIWHYTLYLFFVRPLSPFFLPQSMVCLHQTKNIYLHAGHSSHILHSNHELRAHVRHLFSTKPHTRLIDLFGMQFLLVWLAGCCFPERWVGVFGGSIARIFL